MKICRFNDNRLGLVEAGEVLDVTEALDVLPALRYPFPVSDQLITHLPELRARIETLTPNAKRLPLAQVRLLAPVANPGKIIAAPVNYVRRRKENKVATCVWQP